MKTLALKFKGQAQRCDIVVGRNLAGRIRAFISKLKPTSLVIVSDRNVAKHCGKLINALASIKVAAPAIKVNIAPGEPSKSLKTLENIFNACLGSASPPDRGSIVVALGGGVVGDIAGFFAASYMRGIPVIQVPTTLLAMVDSSVGGKAGVNHPKGKNLIGAFHQPRAVFADVDLLSTLPEREYVGALAEVVKYGVVLDAQLFAKLESRANALCDRHEPTLQDVVTRCIENKARVVIADPLEGGKRVVLNYGHTVGHAIEHATNFKRFTHGEAVAMGMDAAARLGVMKNVTPARTLARQSALLDALGLQREIPSNLSAKSLSHALLHDKKRKNKELRFVLPNRIGGWRIWTTRDAAATIGALRT